MNKIKVVFIVSLVFLGVLVLITVFMPIAKAKTITVDDSGGANYTKIQTAINASLSGDTIYVYNGVYNEQITISKRIILVGESSQNTVIKGSGISNSKGINLTANYVSISNMRVDNFFYGIYLANSNNAITSNAVTNNSYGIYVESTSNNIITTNTITSSTQYGIYLFSSTNNNITSNMIADNTNIYGTGTGIQLDSSTNNTIKLNTITNCEYSGVSVHASSNNAIVNTTITDNTNYDIKLTASSSLTAINTTFDASKLYCDSTSDITVKNYLTIVVYYSNLTRIQNAYVKVSDNENLIFTGQTDANGTITSILVTDRIYNNSDSAAENITVINISYPDWTFIDNNRSVNMGTSHTEYITARDAAKNNNTGAIYGTIQLAINAATADNTIFVYNGIYNEQITISKKINLIGESNQNTIIKGSGVSDSKGVFVTANYVNISNINVNNFWYGIYIFGLNNSITSNTLRNNTYGIYLDFSMYNSITSNTITNSTCGIYVGSSSNNSIASSIITNSSQYGIFLSSFYFSLIYSDANNNSITSSTLINNTDGIYVGSKSKNNTVENTTISNSTDYDIHLYTFSTSSPYSSSLISINTTFNTSKVSCDIISTLTIKNYLNIVVRYPNLTPIQNAYAKVSDNENLIFTGQTDANGIITSILVTDRIYNNSNSATENITTVNVSCTGLVFHNNNRNINMTTSHIEFFTVNQAPIPNITCPINGQNFAQNVTISFGGYGVDAEDGFLADASITWSSNISGHLGGGNISSSILPLGPHRIILNVTDSDGATANATINITIVPSNNKPIAYITTPTDGQSFVEGQTIDFAGYGFDMEDGFLTGASIIWSSNISGSLGVGNKSLSDLPIGLHRFNLTVKDSIGQTASAIVNIAVYAINFPGASNITTTSYTDTDGSYNINWTTVAYADGYILFENNIETYNGTSLTKMFTNKPNGTYIYNVSAWNVNGTSNWSSAVVVIVNIQTQIIVTKTITVDTSGSKDYTTIQAAIDVANAGDTVFVYNGTYNEPLTINKSINLMGESNQDTIIRGSGTSYTRGIDVTANYVNINNINVDSFFCGIYLSTSNNTVTSNIIINSSWSSICVGGSNNNISFNTLMNSTQYNLYLDYYSSNNTIASNKITNCSNGGIYIFGSSNNNITLNNIYGNKQYGLYLASGVGNTATNNWWGSASGPYNVASNPNGTGDSVTNNISFSPWATVPFIIGNITINVPGILSITTIPYTDTDGNYSINWTSSAYVAEYVLEENNVEIYNETLLTHSFTNKTNGIYAYRIKAQNVNGTSNWSSPVVVNVYIVIPNQKPTVSISIPSVGATVSGIVTIIGTAGDSDNNVTYIEIEIDSEQWLKANGTSYWSYIWVTTNHTNGYHNISARAFDGELYSDVYLFGVYVQNQIINQKPTINTSYPLVNAIISGLVNISGTAYDIDGTIQKVEVKIEDDNWQTANGTTTWSFTWNSTTTQNGVCTIYTRSFDGTDYSNIATITVTVNNPISNQKPTVVILNPANGTAVNGTIMISGTASDTDGNVQRVEIKINESAWQNATGTSVWSYSLDITNLSSGNTTIYVSAFDGTDYSMPATIMIRINKLPVVTITSPANNQTVNGTIYITGTSSDDVLVQYVQLSIDNSSWITVRGTASWTYPIETTSLANGKHTIKVRAYDGTQYSDEKSLEIDVKNTKEITEQKRGKWFLPGFEMTHILCLVTVCAIALTIGRRKKD